MNTTFSFKRPGVAAGILGRYNFNPRVSVKASVNYADIGYSDSFSDFTWQRSRNLDFQSHIIDGTVQMEFNFLKYIHGDDDHFFTPYVFGGVSVFHFNPRTRINDEWVALQPLGTEGQARNDEYARTQPAFAFGGGFKFDLNYYWSINIEFSGRYLFTDYLDDVSTVIRITTNWGICVVIWPFCCLIVLEKYWNSLSGKQDVNVETPKTTILSI